MSSRVAGAAQLQRPYLKTGRENGSNAVILPRLCSSPRFPALPVWLRDHSMVDNRTVEKAKIWPRPRPGGM